MNTTLRTLSAALAAALISPSVFAASATLPGIDFHGYMRAGVGVSGDGSEAEWQKCNLKTIRLIALLEAFFIA